MKELTCAVEAVRTGDLAAASSFLLAAWRRRRQSEIAAALEAVGHRLRRPPLTGRTIKERHAAFLAIAAQGESADVPRLVDVLRQGTSADDIQERVQLLAGRGADPRVATVLTEIISDQKDFISKPKFWAVVLNAIESMGDPRQLPALRSAKPQGVTPQRHIGYRGYEVFRLAERLVERIPRIVTTLVERDPPDLPEEDRAAIDAPPSPLACGK